MAYVSQISPGLASTNNETRKYICTKRLLLHALDFFSIIFLCELRFHCSFRTVFNELVSYEERSAISNFPGKTSRKSDVPQQNPPFLDMATVLKVAFSFSGDQALV